MTVVNYISSSIEICDRDALELRRAETRYLGRTGNGE